VQDAVDAASIGDMVFVRSGIYFEDVSVTKSLSLIGESAFDTIIDAQVRSISVIYVKADNVTIRNFTLRNSAGSGFEFYTGGGIYLYSSHGCDIENCIMINNAKGVNVYGSDYSSISNNLVTRNTLGIAVWNSSNNDLVKGNWVLNNSENGDGMVIAPSTKNITILENRFRNNSLFINGPDPGLIWSSASGIIVHNSFMRDATIKIDYYWGQGEPQPNVAWSKDGEGNFWISYSDADADGDGLGDTPYVIDESNNDIFPLMKPYNWITGDVNYDLVVNILDLFAIARAFDSRPGDMRWNLRCDLNNDKTIDILDIFEVASRFKKEMSWPPR
jgi:parallel beta-helix repeat protein